jgi:nucleotide-binding universal stress UspA family protein
MYTNICVPLDGSPFGEHALPLAVSLANRSGSTLTLMHVHTPIKNVYLEGAAFIDESLETELRVSQLAYLQSVRDRVRHQFPSLPVVTRLLHGEVASRLADEAATLKADLMVLTTHGRGPMGRFWLGSVADSLVRQSHVPLLLVRPGKGAPDLKQEPVLRHLLIPLDGSELAEQILETALTLAKLLEADITLVRIVKPVVPLDYPVEVATAAAAVQSVLERVEALQSQLLDEAQKYLDSVARRVKAGGFSVSTRVDFEQQPATAILQDIEESDLHMVALETHGRRGLSRLFLGSVADKVIRGASVPVLVHRPIH